MVQSARVQRIVKGDDVTLKHQIMQDVAFDAEQSRAPVVLQVGDTVKFFYPQETGEDLTGFAGVAVGGLPASEFNVAIPGDIPAVLNVSPERGTTVFQSGLGRTVRAEVTRENTKKETYYLVQEVDVLERGFPNSLDDTSGGLEAPSAPLNLT